MFSKTFERVKQDNLSLWDETKGNYFDKAFALLRVYCGYDSYSVSYFTLYSVNTQRDEIFTIVSMYEKRGYLKTHHDTLVCNIAFLLFLVSKKINRDKINPEGRFVALIHAIEEKTGLKMNAFYQDNLALHAYFKEGENHQDFLKCYSWTEFILRNVKDFLPCIVNANDTNQHPINVQLLQQDYFLDTWSIINSLDGICANKGEVNLLLYCDKKERASLTSHNLKELFNLAVTQLPYDHLAHFFGLMLTEKAYSKAFNLFCIAEKITMNVAGPASFDDLRNKIVQATNTSSTNTFLLKLMEYDNNMQESIASFSM
jgi:hypothetical protein